MNPLQFRRLLFVALVATCLAVPSYAAGRRRAVAHPSPAVALTAELTGTITDSVTGAPINAVELTSGKRTFTTGPSGAYTLKSLSGNDKILVTVYRTGYARQTLTITQSGKQELNIQLVPQPTVRVRLTNGTTYDVDLDSILFGYPIAFSGYRSAEFEDFCKADGTQVVIDRTQIKRIIGPAMPSDNTACCPGKPTLTIGLELRSGESGQYTFSDACTGIGSIDIIARERVSAMYHYLPFSQVAEVVFP
jgi:hypothetical protein